MKDEFLVFSWEEFKGLLSAPKFHDESRHFECLAFWGEIYREGGV
jgi:hypothetical protein